LHHHREKVATTTEIEMEIEVEVIPGDEIAHHLRHRGGSEEGVQATSVELGRPLLLPPPRILPLSVIEIAMVKTKPRTKWMWTGLIRRGVRRRARGELKLRTFYDRGTGVEGAVVKEAGLC
jgi:hypothetical protein